MVECWMVFERLFDWDNKRVHDGPDTVHLFATQAEAYEFIKNLPLHSPTMDSTGRLTWVDPEVEHVFIKEGV